MHQMLETLLNIKPHPNTTIMDGINIPCRVACVTLGPWMVSMEPLGGESLLG